MHCQLARTRVIAVCLIAVLLALPAPVHAYAVLSHEAIIDAAWETHIKPLLLKTFPQATEEDLSRAQAYAYGGAIIQDMGYYPYGSPFFSDLTHYVRSGDFIQALLRDAKDVNEYAFAVGALAHYAADNEVTASAPTEPFRFCIRGCGKNTATAFRLRTTSSRT